MAVGWQRLFGECLAIHILPVTTALLVTGCWCTYVLDRLLDSRKADAPLEPGLRHVYYRRHRKLFLILVLLVGMASIPVALLKLPRHVLFGGVLLSLVVAAYLAVVHAAGPRVGSWFPKEYVVGALFAAGVTLPFWTRLTQAVPSEPLAFLFFLIACQINTVAIDFWESGDDSRYTAAPPTLWLGRHITTAAAALAVANGAAALAFHYSPLDVVFLCTAVSALGMWATGHYRHVLGITRSCTLMDAVLLTPFFAVIALHAAHLIQQR